MKKQLQLRLQVCTLSAALIQIYSNICRQMEYKRKQVDKENETRGGEREMESVHVKLVRPMATGKSSRFRGGLTGLQRHVGNAHEYP